MVKDGNDFETRGELYWNQVIASAVVLSLYLRIRRLNPFLHELDDWTRLLKIPLHPCLEKRRSNQPAKDSSMEMSNSESHVSFNNFLVDRVTLIIMLGILRRTSIINKIVFHNAGLDMRSIQALSKALPQTSILCLSLDFNSALTIDTSASKNEDEDVPRKNMSIPGGLVGNGSKLRVLSLRGNKIGDDEAIVLADELLDNKTLTSLNLFHNSITDIG